MSGEAPMSSPISMFWRDLIAIQSLRYHLERCKRGTCEWGGPSALESDVSRY